MKKFFISKNGYKCKANLGSYTTDSVGKLTAEQLKEEYKKKGYSVVAFSDLDKVINRADIADKEFLPITSYKTAIGAYHFTLYSKTPDNKPVAVPEGDFADIQDKVNAFIEAANKAGYLVCIDHPAKSMQLSYDYDKLSGYFGLEIADYASLVEGHIEDNNHIFDRISRKGIKIYPIAADSNRNEYDFNHPKSDSFGAFTMINADTADYTSVMAALEKGEFYASTGPVFEEVSYDGNKIYVKCSPVKSIRVLNAGRDAAMVVAIANEGELITEAEFEIIPAYNGNFMRVDIRDEFGDFADTAPYHFDELLGE